MKNIKKALSILTIAILMDVCSSFAQGQDLWKEINLTQARTFMSTVKYEPRTFKVFELDLSALNDKLSDAPSRAAFLEVEEKVMTFPNDKGKLGRFKVMEASIMHPDLATKYPSIKSYAGQGIDDPSATIRFSFSDQLGFHGMITSGKHSTSFIDPYSADRVNYMVYSGDDMPSSERGFRCLTSHTYERDLDLRRGFTFERTNDKRLRKYRLALSSTAEYGNIFAGTGTDAQKKARILAQMNATMTRVNGVYEGDLGITLELVPSNDEILFYGNTNADPWSGEYNAKTQEIIDNVIGNSNYDIGHNFNTSGGGNAGCIGCVCTTGRKGSGYTGRSNPTGDAFDIDYVAHEMGHQFGGYHTMNYCKRSGSGFTEVEPGSGSTIMGYAGICPPDIQINSDDYFSYVNIRDISANIQNGISSSCAQIVNLGNNPPNANAGPDFTIPKSTAFVLRGEGSDSDGDTLTYTWEQNDSEEATHGFPQSTWTKGPLFRSIKGTTSPDRYMPQISDVVAGNLASLWEVVPSVSRTMEFSLTVRDNRAGGGQTSDDLMTVTVDASAGPFVVSAPNSNVTWKVGETRAVTWNVTGTNIAPVSCANVNILLSTDGGFTYPITLASNTPNDGSEDITVPNNISSTSRIRVEAADNIFYDISDTAFSIEQGDGGTDTEPPTAPDNLTATSITSSSVDLTWTASTDNVGVTGYNIYIDGSANTTIAGTSHTLAGLEAGTSYVVLVKAKDAAGNESAASEINVTTHEGGCTNVTLNMALDDYPRETSWSITNDSGTIIDSGGPYGASSDGVTKTNCLISGCYTFKIDDSYGDGICCEYGNGSYTLTDVSGHALASGGSFGASEVKNFCID